MTPTKTRVHQRKHFDRRASIELCFFFLIVLVVVDSVFFSCFLDITASKLSNTPQKEK